MTTEHTEIDLSRLKAVICRLIDELVQDTGSQLFQLPEADFYWTIPAEAKMDMSKSPKEFEVGRLRDDWELTHWLADEPTKVSAYSLTEVASLLDFLGESVVRQT